VVRPPVVVVFDVNIYVDVARLIVQPFTWQKFDLLASQTMNLPVPHRDSALYDSLRAIAMSRSGAVGTGEDLEVWTSEHIDNLVISKIHAETVGPDGVAWSEQNAVALHDELVNTLVFDMTRGGSVGRILAALNNPPLDHEDGCVMRTAVDAGVAVESPRYCVTRDRDFRAAYLDDQLEPSVKVLFPSEWIEILRKARRPDLRRMLGGGTGQRR
jgi:hypothetical protein